jgi:hypothetical protein
LRVSLPELRHRRAGAWATRGPSSAAEKAPPPIDLIFPFDPEREGPAPKPQYADQHAQQVSQFAQRFEAAVGQHGDVGLAQGEAAGVDKELLVVGGNTVSPYRDIVRFYSKESPDSALRPYLEVTYSGGQAGGDQSIVYLTLRSSLFGGSIEFNNTNYLVPKNLEIVLDVEDNLLFKADKIEFLKQGHQLLCHRNSNEQNQAPARRVS